MRYMVMFTCSVLVVTMLAGILPSNGEERVYQDVIRLHVLANSDTEQDQQLKLAVRDEILKNMDTHLLDCNTKYEAELTLQNQKEEMEQIAADTIAKWNCSYPVTISLGDEYYPTREYENLHMPAGTYYSVRIKIGEAKGKNWWCILFPPLCLTGAKAEEELVAAGFTPDQVKILTETQQPKYVLRFKLLEFLRQCLGSNR